ncbi:class I SAM-dependent methyltransferase [Actinoplanes sichuanensis]|uniref:Class I SAM-dependent methyltransferase n=1 Tax=Actinoplanes sichuanensis TaxID=512349 RepID=A0ABW4A706_9ACTN|nr:class I SAM-dependent methyltransferase [Actinoplanes sichuanensis]BEL03325.1 class I SAM-dependent methyltransferase [Actinoplanes sichuanensis]
MDHVREAYGSVAGLYIDLFGAEDKVHADDLALIGRHLTGRPGPVLDLGCGPGHITAHLRSRGAEAIGVDLTPEFVEHARATYPDGDYRLGSLTDLPFADTSITGILAWYSTIHLPPPDLDGVLASFHRLLAPGGKLVLGFFTGDELGPFDHKVTTAYRWPPGELSDRLTAAGFTEVERLLRADDPAHRPHGAITAVAGS